MRSRVLGRVLMAVCSAVASLAPSDANALGQSGTDVRPEYRYVRVQNAYVYDSTGADRVASLSSTTAVRITGLDGTWAQIELDAWRESEGFHLFDAPWSVTWGGPSEYGAPIGIVGPGAQLRYFERVLATTRVLLHGKIPAELLTPDPALAPPAVGPDFRPHDISSHSLGDTTVVCGFLENTSYECATAFLRLLAYDFAGKRLGAREFSLGNWRPGESLPFEVKLPVPLGRIATYRVSGPGSGATRLFK